MASYRSCAAVSHLARKPLDGGCSLAAKIELTHDTVREYVSLLQTIRLVRLLPAPIAAGPQGTGKAVHRPVIAALLA